MPIDAETGHRAAEDALRARRSTWWRAIALATALSVLVLLIAAFSDPFGYLGSTLLERITVAAIAMLFPVGAMLAVIGLAAGRGISGAGDVETSADRNEAAQTRFRSAIVRNTFEQGMLAIATYFTAAVLMPSFLLDAIAMAAVIFAIGRVLFVAGHVYGAHRRALGFGLTFAPTVLLFLTTVLTAGR